MQLGNGLILTPQLFQRQVSVDLKFEPSVGILARKVDKLGMDIKSFREPLQRAVKQVMIPSIRTNFDSGGRPPWQPLAESTVRIKKGDDRPLIRTGLLRRVMSQMNIWSIDSEKAMITDLPDKVWYGKVHQAGATYQSRFGGFAIDQTQLSKYLSYGGKRMGKKDVGEDSTAEIPARPFVVLQQQDIDDIERVFDEWLAERMAAAGLGRG